MDRGYTKLIVTVNIPFKTVNITFAVWDASKLQSKERCLLVGDFVEMHYHYQGTFAQLDTITRIGQFDTCHKCYCNLEAMDAQRFECSGCATISEAEQKDRVSEKMQLTECELQQYTYSAGYKIKFLCDDKTTSFASVIFKNSPLYDKLEELKILNIYHVTGWKNKQGFKANPFEIVNIHNIY